MIPIHLSGPLLLFVSHLGLKMTMLLCVVTITLGLEKFDPSVNVLSLCTTIKRERFDRISAELSRGALGEA